MSTVVNQKTGTQAMTETLEAILNAERYPLGNDGFRTTCRQTLADDGCLVLDEFLTPKALESVRLEGEEKASLAFYCAQQHNVYLSPPDSNFPPHHPRNRTVVSSKGCITDDQIRSDSVLRTLYDATQFRAFLCAVLGENALYEYADSLSSINLHYAANGQELGWHLDNSSFAITLLIQAPETGGTFEYVRNVRDSKRGEMNYAGVGRVLDGEVAPQSLAMTPGTLVLFRGRDSIHRVTPAVGQTNRMLVVLAYNSEPGISLSESARMTFYGRLA